VTRSVRCAWPFALLWAGCGGAGGGGPAVDAAVMPGETVDLVVVSDAARGTVTVTGPRGPLAASRPGVYTVPLGTRVTLAAAPKPGNHFAGMSSNVQRDAGLTGGLNVNRTQTATVSFLPITHNLVFASSRPFSPTAGIATYDQACNDLAQAVGIDPLSYPFMAWMSTLQEGAGQRIAGYRGFVRMDGRPVADDLTGEVRYYPISVDETVQPAYGTHAFTGTDSSGQVLLACNGWSQAASLATTGAINGGPDYWTADSSSPCSAPLPIYCVMRKFRAAFTPPTAPGKLIFLSDGFLDLGAGVAAADALCDAEKPAGRGRMVALLGTTTAPAASRLVLTASYVRGDGQLVGSGGDLALGQPLTGLWVHADGSSVRTDRQVVTGGKMPDKMVMAENNCRDLTDRGLMLSIGRSHHLDNWWSYQTVPCTEPFVRAYCVEQ